MSLFYGLGFNSLLIGMRTAAFIEFGGLGNGDCFNSLLIGMRTAAYHSRAQSQISYCFNSLLIGMRTAASFAAKGHLTCPVSIPF